jgi:hypothetical protein
MVSMASSRAIAGKRVVSRRASIAWPAPGGPRRRTLRAECLHHVQHRSFSGSAEHLPTCCTVESGVTRQVIIVFSCTSKPAQWVKITSMVQLPWQRGWQDTQWSRLCSACSPPNRKMATILGAYGYPGQTDVWVCGTPVSPTARPAYAPSYTASLIGKKRSVSYGAGLAVRCYPEGSNMGHYILWYKYVYRSRSCLLGRKTPTGGRGSALDPETLHDSCPRWQEALTHERPLACRHD